LPRGTWGIVDSNLKPGYKIAAAIPLLQREMVPAGEKLGFVCLTHYHDDHFKGMSQILDYSANYCGDNGSFYHNGFSWCEAYPELGWESGIASMLGIRDQFERGIHPFQDRGGVFENQSELLEDGVSVHFIAPAHARQTSVLHTLFRNIEKQKVANKPFNRIGIAFYVKYGQATLLFSDDIGAPSWRRIMKRCQDLDPCWIKVAHHGAASGNVEGLWEWLARAHKGRKKLHAVISADGVQHPDRDLLGHIAKYATVHLTYSSEFVRLHHLSPLETMTSRKRRTTSTSPKETWRTSLQSRWKDCEFAVFSDGTVQRINGDS